ncbi:glycosyltransferase family 4 protein [Chroococcus sp. FPU101]|uniref:glycosyltransferase family 4 protein n=1 Tax=Chroococcus sp. FPU101 TaxID=1974212 RepID=UPI001A8CD2E6|nr:glycosyltransferase family 4 protein [Chroococcus sp. FPU101]GFE67657.1 glycosyl transferase group 1 [Chroococcus sp. FPU101]
MKILLLNDFGTPTGGAELQILSLRQGLRERGHEVRLLSSGISPVKNVDILADYQCFGTNTKFQVISQTVNPSAYLCLRQILHEFKPDVVHVRIFMGQLSPLILPLLKNVPCLYQAAMYRAICPTGKKILPDGSPCQSKPGLVCLRQECLTPQSWSVLMLQRQLWLHWQQVFDMVVALSHGMKDKLEAEGIKPVHVVYNGVPERPPRPPLSNTPTVAYAGRLSFEKGIHVLLQAFAKSLILIPEARLMIAGQGSEKTNLLTLADELGISQQIVWLDHVSRTELENHFDLAWVQVVPSLWDEPFGNVTTEAMMRGTAVIASAVGAQPEIVEDGVTGFLVPADDVEKLASALVQLLSKPTLAEQMGQAGRQRALSHFSENRRTEHFLELYQKLYATYHI